MLWAFVSLGTSLVASGQMYTQGRFIYTADGEKVILRGVNEMLVWSTDPSGSWVMAEMAKRALMPYGFRAKIITAPKTLKKRSLLLRANWTSAGRSPTNLSKKYTI